MKTNPFNDFWRGKEVKTEPSKIQKSDFKTLWKGGEAALAKGAMDELKNYIQLRLDQNIPQDKALDQAIAVNGRLPEMKRLDPSEVETLVEQVYNKTEKSMIYATKPGGERSTSVQPDSDTDATIRDLKKRGFTKIWDAETNEIYYNATSKSQVQKARTVGAHWKSEIKKLVMQAKKQGIVNNGQVAEYVKDNLPDEAFDTWEGAYSEVERLAEDFNMQMPDPRPGYMR